MFLSKKRICWIFNQPSGEFIDKIDKFESNPKFRIITFQPQIAILNLNDTAPSFALSAKRIIFEKSKPDKMKKLFLAIRHNDLQKVKDIIGQNPGLVHCTAKQPPKKDDGQ